MKVICMFVTYCHKNIESQNNIRIDQEYFKFLENEKKSRFKKYVC